MIFSMGFMLQFRSDIPTEVWDFTSGDKKEINPVLTKETYDAGSALYLVDLDYCRKQK